MKNRKIIFFVPLSIFFILLFSFYKPINKYFYVAKSLNVFSTLFKELTVYYVDSVDTKTLIEGSIEGMLSSLDPYGAYIDTEHAAAFTMQHTGRYAGIGALIGIIEGRVLIMDVYANSPAKGAGLKIGDEIILIDGVAVGNDSVEGISKRLQGRVNTAVDLLVKRQDGADSIEVTLVRKKIQLNNIAYWGMLPGGVGYIKLNDFRTGAALEVERAVNTLKQRDMVGLILDLRNNPGGLLYESINVANVFLPQGLEVVSVKGRVEAWNKSYVALNHPIDIYIPVVVLINEGSASASEIVAGALQDYDRAVLLGRRTFGKGLLQTTRSLPYDVQLKITTAKYYIPSGRCIQAVDYTHGEKALLSYGGLSGQEYRTRCGRIVYEGQGIAPDMSVEVEYLTPVTVRLITSGQLFDYAIRFCATHAPPNSLTDFTDYTVGYDEFVSVLAPEVFSVALDAQVEKVVEVAKKEGLYADIKDQMPALRYRIAQYKMANEVVFKEEIIRKLKEEIAFHYGMVDNRVEMTLGLDKEVIAAKKLLQDSLTYHNILSSI